MTTTHEVPPVEGKLKTVARFETDRPSLLDETERVTGSATATLMSTTIDGELEGRIFFAVGGNKGDVNVLEAAALTKALLEHLGHRGELNHGGDLEQAFCSSIKTAEAIVNDNRLPEDGVGTK